MLGVCGASSEKREEVVNLAHITAGRGDTGPWPWIDASKLECSERLEGECGCLARNKAAAAIQRPSCGMHGAGISVSPGWKMER